jgi:hypothetical protein
MADKAPVQDKLSKILAELMWSLAGTEDEDEYAGEYYMQMQEAECGDDVVVEGDGKQLGDCCDDDECNVGECGDDGVVYEDADGDTMEIIEMNDSCSDNDEGEEGEEEERGDSDDEVGVEDEQQRIREMNERHCRGAHLVSLYISTFLCTVRREWGNVDKHRVDKFYTAVRFMIREVCTWIFGKNTTSYGSRGLIHVVPCHHVQIQAYIYMSKRNWNVGIVQLINDAIFNEGLSAETQGLTNGLRYHLIDICVDELAKANRNAPRPLTEATFVDCLEPFFGLAKMAGDKHVQQRVMQNVLLKFLNEYSFVSAAAAAAFMEDEASECHCAENEKSSLIFKQVHVGTVSRFIFTVASDSDTDERYRKSLYDMHKAYTRQIRLAGRDVEIDDHDPEDDEEEITSDGHDEVCNLGEIVQGICSDDEVLELKNTAVEEVAAFHEKNEFDPTDATPEKKKKRKKKKKAGKASSGDNEAVNPTKSEAADNMCVDGAAPEDTHSSRKRKKAEKDASSGDNDILIPTTPKATDKMCVDAIVPEKKSKKKKKAADGISSRDDETERRETTKESDQFNDALVHLPSSKKKKEKQCCKAGSGNDVASDIPGNKMGAKMKDMTTDLTSTPESKSSKKKRKIQEDTESANKNTKEDLITTHVETPAVGSCKKKTKQNSSPPSVDPRSMNSPDQVVINQNASFEEFGSSDDNDISSSPSKRVSFGKMNHCKSHKASMKAIKTLDKGRWDTSSRTPDKSILRPKVGIVSSVKKGQNMKASPSQLSSSKKSKKK